MSKKTKSKKDRFVISRKTQLTSADRKDYYQKENENALEFLKRVLNT